MTTRKASVLSVALFALFCMLTAPTLPVHAAPDDDTQDIVYMADGRILHGQILDETLTTIVFEYTHDKLGITTTLELKKSNISKIDHDTAVVADASGEETAEDMSDEPIALDFDDNLTSKTADLDMLRTLYGALLAADDSSLPSVYLAPMRGQMGTDVHKSIYEDVVKDIDRVKPDLVVWVLQCADQDDFMIHREDPADRGKLELEHYRELVNLLKDDRRMKSMPQVMWVHDSLGISSVMALAWADMYMGPEARLDGLSQIFAAGAGWSDPDVRAKMLAAWIAIGNGFLQNGGYPLELGRAMIDPSITLSASWRGREVLWMPSGKGDYVVDDSNRRTASFSAKTAEDFLISDGTAGTLDDLMLLYGYREYRLADGLGEELVAGYIEDWRRGLEQAEDLAIEFNQHQRWASGEDRVKWLGRSKTDLRKLLALFDRFEAVEIRMGDEGWNRLQIEIMIEEISDTIRSLKAQDRGGGRGGGRGGAGDGPRGGGG